MNTYKVTNGNDSGVGSLREAVTLANANAGQDEIVVDVQNIILNTGIEITDSVSVIGKTLVTQTGSDRLFKIDDGNTNNLINVYLDGLSLTGGNPKEFGGAIHTLENLSIKNANIYNNATTLAGGAIFSRSALLEIADSKIYGNTINTGLSASAGGAIYVVSNGKLELTNSVVDDNQAKVSGGIALVTNSSGNIINSQISNNLGQGIGVLFDSQVTISSSTIANNISQIGGGGIHLEVNATAIVNNSTITGNETKSLGGGIGMIDYSTLELNNSFVLDNKAVEYGGAIDASKGNKVTIVNSTISNNSASNINGISSYDDSDTIRVIDSTVTDKVQASVVFITTPAKPNLELTEVHRFYQFERGFHFYTADSNESNVVKAQSQIGTLSYNYEGTSFAALSSNLDDLTGAAIADAEGVYRFFNSQTGAHLYTIDENEKTYILDNLSNYTLEGTAYYAFETEQESLNTIPVYRMLNSDNGTHLFTTDSNELSYIKENLANFSLEGNSGVAFYVMETM